MATQVPAAVYGIPVSSPVHYVAATAWCPPPVTYGYSVAVTYTPWTGWTMGFIRDGRAAALGIVGAASPTTPRGTAARVRLGAS